MPSEAAKRRAAKKKELAKLKANNQKASSKPKNGKFSPYEL